MSAAVDVGGSHGAARMAPLGSNGGGGTEAAAHRHAPWQHGIAPSQHPVRCERFLLVEDDLRSTATLPFIRPVESHAFPRTLFINKNL